MRHYVQPYLLNPNHRIGVLVIGCGGTGSRVLSGLADMSFALQQLGHPGLYVVAADDDMVSSANLGRQAFGVSDVDRFKASVLIERLNKAFGTDWLEHPEKITSETDLRQFGPMNLVVTCVDSAAARVEIGNLIAPAPVRGDTHENHSRQNHTPSYWLDFGNNKDSGQIILGTLRGIAQPDGVEEGAPSLPTVLDFFPNLSERDEEDDTPSCSTREALAKQDLFVNRIMADFGLNLFWRLLKFGYIETQGAFVGLESMTANPLRIDPVVWSRFGIGADGQRIHK